MTYDFWSQTTTLSTPFGGYVLSISFLLVYYLTKLLSKPDGPLPLATNTPTNLPRDTLTSVSFPLNFIDHGLSYVKGDLSVISNLSQAQIFKVNNN